MSVRVEHGDCVQVIRTLADASIDSVVCDPPYALVSIVKRFGKPGTAPVKVKKLDGQGGSPYARGARGFMGKQWDTGEAAFDPEFWADVLRVLKPGAHLIAFGGTRTYHRLACAIEDAGFEIRDQIGWCYGSGFPKSHNIPPLCLIEGGQEFDDQGTALKPAWEPICLARKPLNGTVLDNVLGYGTGALNIAACRVGDFVNDTPPGTDRYNQANYEQGYRPNAYQSNGREGEASADKRYTEEGATNFAAKPGRRYTVKRWKPGATLEKTGGNWRPEDGGVEYHGEMPPGRWPANVIHDGSEEVLQAFPDAPGQQRSVSGDERSKRTNVAYGDFGRTDGGMDPRGDEGSAARFFYTAKADAEDRLGSKHPTVKPVDLMRYLARLITPPKGLVLDPFAGTGTTGLACMAEGFDCILIEREAEYIADIERRLAWARGEGPLTEQLQTRNIAESRKRGDDTPLFGGTEDAGEVRQENLRRVRGRKIGPIGLKW